LLVYFNVCHMHKPLPRYHAVDLFAQHSGLLLHASLAATVIIVSSTNLLHCFHTDFCIFLLKVLCWFRFCRTMDKADNLPDSTPSICML